MGLFSKKPKETPEEKREKEIFIKVMNSEAGKKFYAYLKVVFSKDEEWYKYLIADTRNRAISLQFQKEGLITELIDTSSAYYEANGTYTVEKFGIPFAALGYADLPDSSYLYAFSEYMLNCLKSYPYLDIDDNNPLIIFVKLKETEKKVGKISHCI